MEPTAKNKWWQGSWTIPVSLLLHVLIGATYLLSSTSTPVPAEPETVNVEMVEPPKEEPPPKPEDKKAEEQPPPPAPEKPAEPPPPSPPPPQMPSVAIRPGPTQLDERDEPGQQEAGGQEQKVPETQPDMAQPAQTPPEVAEEKPEAEAATTAAAEKATAEEGEISASQAPPPPDVATVAVPVPKPDVKPPPEPAKAAPDGEEGTNLKPAKKILVGAKRPGPMLRQIMGDLPPKQRVAQLCVAEAMAQIKQERNGKYDGLEPHTGKTYPISGNLMNAQGAFNVGTQWFPINYRCEVDIDNYIVTDFRYDIGAKLTPDDIKRLKLVVR